MADLNNVLEILRCEKFMQFNQLFMKFKEVNPNLVYEGKVVSMIKDICVELEVEIGNGKELVESFRVIYRNTWKFRTLEEFKKIVIGWLSLNQLHYLPATRCKKEFVDYISKVKKYYEGVKSSMKDEDKRRVSAAVNFIDEKVNLLKRIYYFEAPCIAIRNQILECEKEALQEIFDFYASSHIILSKFSTFDALKAQKRMWTCGVFVKFCTVFGLYGKFSGKKSLLSHKTVLDIFTKFSILKKSMNFQGFFKSLEEISLEFYKIPGIFKFPISLSALNPTNCIIALFDRMKLMRLVKIRKILKESVKGFNLGDINSRIGPDDPCMNYKFLPSPKAQNKLREIKTRKKLISSQRKTVVPHSEPSIKTRTRPLSSYQSVCGLRKTNDIVRVYSHSKSKASFDDFNFDTNE